MSTTHSIAATTLVFEDAEGQREDQDLHDTLTVGALVDGNEPSRTFDLIGVRIAPRPEIRPAAEFTVVYAGADDARLGVSIEEIVHGGNPTEADLHEDGDPHTALEARYVIEHR